MCVSQSYGYEEASTGDLVAQRAPHHGYSGVGTDTLGPGVYEPNDRYTTTSHATPAIDSWARSGTHREMLKPADPAKQLPGPGAYNPRSVIHGRRISKRVTPQFASKVNRWQKNETAAKTPGPGTYDITSVAAITTHDTPQQFQFFGSKTSRTVQVTTNTKRTAYTRNQNLGITCCDVAM